MVHGLFRASGIVMIYRLNHDSSRRLNGVQFRMPGSVLASTGGSVLESAEGTGQIARWRALLNLTYAHNGHPERLSVRLM
jgi:hypothetical protein